MLALARRFVAAAVILILVLSIAAVLAVRHWIIVLDPPPPRVLADVPDSIPRLPLSVVEAPVSYDLRAVIDSLEAAVPVMYGDLDHRIPTAKNKHVSFAFLLKRSPFRVQVRQRSVVVSADVDYTGRIWYDPPVGPAVALACGTSDEPPRRATLTVESTGELTEDWNLRTHSRVVQLAPFSESARDRCRLSFLRIDVTRRILESTHESLDEKLAEFDAAVARWPVRKRFQDIWRTLQKPLWLSDSLYLTINPSQAELGEVGAVGDSVYANLRLFAEPRIIAGPRPARDKTPLPPLRLAHDVGRGARVLMEASFAYPMASAILRKALVGVKVEQVGRTIRIRDVSIAGIGAGKVAVGVRISGAVRGRLYFTGTPQVDTVRHEIVVPDLDYDVGSAEILVRGFEWLNDVKLRDFLREQARLPDSVVMRRVSQLADGGMNRDLPARGTHLSGHVGRAGIIDVRATREELRVRAIADADLTLSINRAPSIPRPPDLQSGAMIVSPGQEPRSREVHRSRMMMTPRSFDQAFVASLSVAASAGGKSPSIHACQTGASRAAMARAWVP